MAEQDQAKPSQPLPPPSRPEVGWKGALRATEVIRYRWQRDWTKHTNRSLQTRERWRELRIVTALGGTAILVGVLLFYLLYFPDRVPMLTLVVTDYSWPLAPNAWAQEDLNTLQRLDEPGTQTLRLVDGSPSWRTQQRGLRHLDDQLQQLAPQATRAGLLVLYISMHGAVNDLGEPCLLTRESIPRDSNTWLPLRTILEKVNSPNLLPASVKKLVILDCNRLRTDWNSGQLYNSFAERISQLVSAESFPNLSVLNSTGPGQLGATSADLQGSVFGHFLHLGLAGAADLRGEGGNGDGRVSARELVSYLQHHVGQWTKQFSDDPQQPVLMPADLDDFDVAWRLNPGVLEKLISQAGERVSPAPTISARERNELWRRRDEFWASQPHRFDALAWRDFEHQLVWLEQLAESGSGYASLAVQVAQSIRQRSNQLATQLREARQQPTLPNYVRAFAAGPLQLPREMSVHSLSLASFLGSADAAALQSARALWQGLANDVSESHRQKTLDQLRVTSMPQPLAEAQFLHFFQRYQLLPLWDTTAVPQQAFRLQDAARRLDAPPSRNGVLGDERAHYWIQADLDLADTRRREAEDRLLSGTDPSDASLTEFFSTSLYERAEEDLSSIAQGLDRRDEAWARVVYWSRWLTRAQRTVTAQEVANDQINEQLLPLIQTLHDFDEALVRKVPDWQLGSEQQPPSRRWSSSHLVADLEQRLQEMNGLCERETARLLETDSEGASTLHEIEQWLLLPLCSWDQRGALQEKRERILDQLRRSFQPTSANEVRRSARTNREELPSATENHLEDVGEPHPLRILSAWNVHPASAILRLSEAIGGETAGGGAGSQDRLSLERPLEHCEELGALIRRRLRMLARDEFVYGIEGSESASEGTVVSEETVVSGRDAELSWEACCRAEARVRAAAPFSFPPPNDDPIHRLRRRDLQQLLLWNARRTMNDCWGSAGLSAIPYFLTVSESYLEGAEGLIPAGPAVRSQLDYLKANLRERRLGIEQALVVTASDVLFVDEAANTSTRMIVRSGPSREIAGRSLPEGELVSFLRDDQGRFAETTRVISTTMLKSDKTSDLATWDFTLPGATLINRGPMLEAITTFRGNEYQAPLLLRIVGGRLVNVDLPPMGPTEVTLRGPRRRLASIQFILDCSQSMSDMETVEAPGSGPANEQPRIDVARQALEAILRQLAAENEHRVGVRFFGHRVGWSVVESGKLLRQNKYVGEIPEGLQPYEDVELVLPLGRFDESALGTVTRHLRSVLPWGETPLYLSLIEALGDFSRDESSGKRTIVAITDGLNNQFNPPREYAKLATDVLNAAAGQDVTIFIVGFGIPVRERAQAQAEFSMIAEATGGAYIPATNASLLLRSLEDLLRPSEFQLTRDDGNLIGSAAVGGTIQVHPVSPLPERFHLSYEGLATPLDLRGGERVQLQVSPDGSRLESTRVGSPGFPQQEFSDTTHQPVGVRGRAHRPVREESGVRFTVSLQRDDNRYFARPAEVWGEVRPMFPPGSEPNESLEPDYVFFETVFAEDQPVPVLHWFAERWPAGARRAEIRIWCRPHQGARPNDTVPLLTIADQVPPHGSGFTRSAVPDISFQTRIVTAIDARDRQRVVVIERHQGQVSEVGEWRIDLRPVPRRIERKMDPAQQVALHTFFLEGVLPEELSRHELRFTSKSRFTEDAWYLPEPILVEIADRSDLLQLSPP